MKLEQSFEIAAPLDQVWTALIDLERVAPCLPGAAITGRDDDGTYRGSFVIKLGPTTASYNGTVRIEAVDEASHTATLIAKGTDKRGQGGASATIVNRLSAAGDATRVDSTTDMTITGKLARFGRPGMMQDISNRMLGEFATCLQSRLQTGDLAGQSAGAEAGGAGGTGAGSTPEGGGAGGTVPEGVVAGERAPDISADLAAEGRAAAAADTPMAASPTGAPTGMAGGALAGAPATAPAGGMDGIRPHTPTPPPASGGAGGSGESAPLEAAPPVEGLSLMAGVAGDQLKRNALPLGVLVALLLLLLLRRRRG